MLVSLNINFIFFCLQYADCNFVLQFFVVNNKSFIKLPFYHYSFAAALLQLGYVTVLISFMLIYHVCERLCVCWCAYLLLLLLLSLL